jgi:hypothetical protein
MRENLFKVLRSFIFGSKMLQNGVFRGYVFDRALNIWLSGGGRRYYIIDPWHVRGHMECNLSCCCLLLVTNGVSAFWRFIWKWRIKQLWWSIYRYLARSQSRCTDEHALTVDCGCWWCSICNICDHMSLTDAVFDIVSLLLQWNFSEWVDNLFLICCSDKSRVE